MNRRFLALIVPVLAAASFLALAQSIAIAAPPGQDAPIDPDVSPAGAAVSPTIRIQIRQQIPLTATLLTQMATSEGLTETAALTATEAITAAAVDTATAAFTTTLAPTATAAITGTAESAAAVEPATDAAANEADDAEAVTFVLDLALDFVVSESMTMTVPATLTIVTAGGLTETVTGTLPVSLDVGVSPTAMVTVTALAVTPSQPITETAGLTSTAAVTAADAVTPAADITVTAPVTTPAADDGAVVTPTVPATGADSVEATTTTTVNVRAGPGTDFEIIDTLSPGTSVQVEAISEDSLWYLLDSAAWIFNTLLDSPPADVPLATPALIEAVTQQAAAAPAEDAAVEPAEEPAEEPAGDEAQAPAAETEPAAEAPADEAAVPTVTVDANLRAGPSTDFEIIGGTVTGQTLNIIGQNAAGDWYLLDNGGWVFANLVTNPPANVPVVPDDATPESAGAAPAEGAAPVLPTPTPQPGGDDAAGDSGTGSIVLGLEETLYIDEVNNIANRYETTASTVEELAERAAANAAALQDATWQGQMNTALQVFTRTGEEIRNIDPPPLFAAAHIDFVNAAGSFDQAAALLTAGLEAGNPAALQQAVAEFEVGRTLLARGQEQLAASTP